MTVEEFWRECRLARPGLPLALPRRVQALGATAAQSDRVLGFIVAGQKTALFSLRSDRREGEPAPRPGDLAVFTHVDGQPCCLVRLVECREVRFGDVGVAETSCESPAARDPAVWRDIHRRFWEPTLASRGAGVRDDLVLVFQRFELLHAHPRSGGGT